MAKNNQGGTAKKTGKAARGAIGVAPPTKKTATAGKPAAGAIDWAAELAQTSAARRWTVPWFVLMQEAATASSFVVKHWKRWRPAGKNSVAIPGLETVAKLLPASVAEEIREIQGLAHEAHQEFLLRTRPQVDDDPRARGEFVLGELTAALEFLFDDGVEDQRDDQLAAVAHAHADDGESNAALASALEDYGLLARAHRADLDGLGGFDVNSLKEIGALAKALRQPTSGGATERTPEAAQALDRRNRLGNLLYERISRVRRAAQFVFRARPEIVREVTSTYLRRQRAAARRAAAQTAPSTPAG